MRNQTSETTRPSQDRSGAFWLIQAFSGVLLVPLLALHMIAHHFVVEGGLREFQDVIDYIANPTIFTISIIFLVVVTIHAMLGLRAVFIDLRPSADTRKLVDRLLIAAIIVVIGYGLWLEITIASM